MPIDRLLRWWRAGHRQDERHAARVALGLLVPGVALVIADRPELILFVVFGSFAGMYGRLEAPVERLRHQFHGAGMLVTGVGLGLVLAHAQASGSALLACVTAFATLGSLATDRLGLRPGGPFFGIFALGATATVSPDLVDPWVALGLCAATAAFTVVLGLAVPLLQHGPGLILDERGPVARVGSLVGTRAQAVRYAVATAVAGLGGLALGLEHANWAMAAAAVPLAVVAPGEPLAIGPVVHRAGHRLAGTLAGLLVTSLLLLPEPGPVLLATAVMLLLFPTELFMSRHHGVALGFFTPLIMCMTELADPTDPVTLLVARGADTMIGVAAGVGAAMLVSGPNSRTSREREQAWAG